MNKTSASWRLKWGRLAHPFKCFPGDRSGMGAVEFALVAPVLLGLYIFGSELAIGLTLNRKVDHAAYTVNDLVTQSTTLSKDDIAGILSISAALIEPYDQSDLSIRITSVKVETDGSGTVEWSRAVGTENAREKGAKMTLPTQFSTLSGRWLLVTETYYDYAPLGGYGLDSIAMGETAYLSPRVGAKVECSDCNAPPPSEATS